MDISTQQEEPQVQNLWNNQQAAEFLNISPFSLRGKVLRREVPFIKIGRRTLFDPEDLRAWVEDCKMPPKKQGAK
jgi:excisionase family DNA binding protein